MGTVTSVPMLYNVSLIRGSELLNIVKIKDKDNFAAINVSKTN